MPINWFEGDVSSAVVDAKDKQASLIVFVKWNDEFTTLYSRVLEKLDLSNKWYVAISLKAHTDEYEQLKEIYKVVPVPSILVIDWESGMVMERVAGPVFDEELQEAFLDAITNRPPHLSMLEGSMSEVREELSPKPETPEPGKSDDPPKPLEARIQFKHKSGETKTTVFPANATLGDVRAAVRDLFHLDKFDLAVPYPRRTLEGDDRSVEQLDLCPASMLLVLPHEAGSLVPWNFLQVIGGLFQPILTFLLGIWRRIFGTPPPPASSAQRKNE